VHISKCIFQIGGFHVTSQDLCFCAKTELAE